jgi:gelsolin
MAKKNLNQDVYSNAARTKIASQSKLASDFFKTVGLVEGLQVWRIEKFLPVEVPKANHGAFYENDSYIVLKSSKIGNVLMHAVHFWIGETSTQDEYGAAAYVTVEIDDHFGGKPVQYREVMGYESDTFRSYFPNGLQILKGGIASGFKHVDTKAEFKVRLMQIKGKKHIQVTEVPCARSSLNSGDVFVLNTFTTIFLWIGKECGAFERNKGGTFATALKEQTHFHQNIVTLDDGGKDDNADFWAALGGKGPVKTAAQGGSDLDADSGKSHGLKQVYKVSDASGQLKFIKVADGKFGPQVLKSEDVFIVDSGYDIFVWIGKGSTAQERKGGMSYAQKYLTDNNRPSHLPISKLNEGVHLPSFDAVFATV